MLWPLPRRLPPSVLVRPAGTFGAPGWTLVGTFLHPAYPCLPNNGRLEPLDDFLWPLGRAPPGPRCVQGSGRLGGRGRGAAMGPDPEEGVGRSEENPIWDWKSPGSRDWACRARPAVAGRKGRSSGPCAARLPARPPPSGSGRAGPRSPPGGCAEPSAARAARVRTPGPGVQALCGCRRNHGGCLLSPPLLCLSVYNMATCL